jgi:hypothetical protein
MKVYIVHRDIAYEFGEVHDVCTSKEEAEASRSEALEEEFSTEDPEDWSIQNWDVKCPKCEA